MEPDEVVDALGSDREAGLSEEEAVRRLAEHGPNALAGTSARSSLSRFLDQLRDVLVWILLGAAAISGLLLGDLVDAGVILAIVILNSTIGFVQESRAEDALARLRELSAPEAGVVRSRSPASIPAERVVPGDLLVVEPGDRVAADARLVEGIDLEADESSLTGESLPVRKQVRPVDADAGVGDRICMLFAGTVVTAGRGSAVVVSTGGDTEMGTIAQLLEDEEPPTPLQVELARIGRRIGLLAGVAAVVVFGLGLARAGEIESLLLTAVALGVAAIPEGLPAVSTITLARGVRAMAERNAIVRRLPAVEALGAATVICTDKTGTLTRNQMALQEVVLGDGTSAATRGGDRARRPGEVSWAEVAVLCSDVSRGADGWRGDPTEVALVEGAARDVLDVEGLRRAAPRVAERSFDSARKRMSTVHRTPDGLLLAAKGAPEVILGLCTRVRTHGGELPLDDTGRARLEEAAAGLAARGLRTLALASRSLPALPDHPEEAEHDLVLEGVVGLSDEVRPEAAPAVETAKQAGITVVMVTGDHEVTARAVATEVGLLDGRRVMPGRELRALDAATLAPRVDEIGVYARVDPTDKVTIVEAWQSRGAIVAMTGDGVNDAPALRMADIGVAMGSGTDVAKEASDMVLADDNFASIVAAVERGREIFANLKKVVYFLLAANISEIVVMVVGFLLFGALGEPLLAVQLLWINLVTDGLPALALGVDPPPPGVMRRAPDVERDILGPAHQLRLFWQAALIATGPLVLYWYGALVLELPWEAVRTMAFTAIVLGQLLFAFVVRAQAGSVWNSRPRQNPWLLVAVTASVCLQLLVVYTPLGRVLFETTPLRVADWPPILLAALVPFLVVDAVKGWIRRRHPDLPTAYD